MRFYFSQNVEDKEELDNMYDEKIKALTVDEYFYLTENLEVADRQSIEKGVGFILYSRQQKIVDIVRQVLENELTDFERKIIKEHLSDGATATEIQEKYRIPRSTFYRYLNSAKAKLKSSLKYVWLYDNISVPNSTEGLLEYVKKAEH